MGMFDYVDYKTPCIKCRTMLTDFQSKDGECTLSTLEPSQVKRFYTMCDKCKTWNEYKVVTTTYRIMRVKPEDKVLRDEHEAGPEGTSSSVDEQE